MEYQENPQKPLPLPLSAREIALLDGFRRLNEQAQKDVQRVVNALLGLPA